jgi:hypothetical protein
MKVIIIPFIIAFIVSNTCIVKEAYAAPEHTWKKWKQFKNLTVSSRVSSVEQLTEIKATAIVNSTLSGFLSFIQDVNNTPNWLANVKNSKILKKLSATEQIFTIDFSTIWPLQPRYLQLNSHFWQNSDLSVEIELKDDFNISINNSSAVRVTLFQGHWLITPKLSNNKRKQLIIEYTFIADNGGDIPKWLADQLTLKSILKSMKKMSLLLPQSKWQQQSIPCITELNL